MSTETPRGLITMLLHHPLQALEMIALFLSVVSFPGAGVSSSHQFTKAQLRILGEIPCILRPMV